MIISFNIVKSSNEKMLRRFGIAGVTVLFYPDEMLVDRINSYLDSLDILYVIDNSEESFLCALGSLVDHNKIKYIYNHENLGIAQALNIAADLALSGGYDFLLTMDQDSSFETDKFEIFIGYLNKIDLKKVGILSPVHVHPKVKYRKPQFEIEKVKLVMTSGNLINLAIFRKVGNFMNELFIDHVDHEYCLRLRSKGYQVMIAGNILLNHSLGDFFRVGPQNFTLFKFISHQPVRTYYMIRNGLFVARKYQRTFPDFYRQNMVLTMKEVIKVIFEKEKIKRIRLILLAIRHYKTYRLGKLT